MKAHPGSSLSAAIVSAVVLGLLVAVSVAAGASTTPSCEGHPLPRGCVTSIKYVDPSTYHVDVAPDGSAQGTWSPDAAGVTEQLDTPVPLAEAEQHAAATSSSRSFGFNSHRGSPASSKRSRHTHSSAYDSVCAWAAPHPTIVGVSGNKYHMHAQSRQTCHGMSVGVVLTDLYVGDSHRASDSDSASDGSTARTNAWDTCYLSGSPHNWWNYSNFFAYDYSGRLVQGPSGFFSLATHHCL
jgi:hypothetical protein